METTTKVNGFTIKIVNDEHAESPDSWGDNEAFLVYDHRQLYVERKGFNPEQINEHCAAAKRLFYDGYFVFPVYAYIHSGVSLSFGRSGWPFNCPWDTSLRGFALIKREKGTWNKDAARKVAKGIVETWNQYLSGDIWGFQIEDANGDEVDACWGFYGEDACKEDANASVAYLIGEQFKKRIAQVKTFIRNRVPLEVRLNTLKQIA